MFSMKDFPKSYDNGDFSDERSDDIAKPVFKYEVIITEISKITLEKGQVLIVKIPKEMTSGEIRDFAKALEDAFGTAANQITIVRKDIDFEITEIKPQTNHPLY